MKSTLFKRVVAAGPGRKTRLHDEKGNFIGLKRLALNAPRAFTTGLLRIVLGYRPVAPWISYEATEVLESFLSQQSRVLEFGAGMSTLWFAKHAGAVYSIEDSMPWYTKLKTFIQEKRISNVHLHYSSTIDEYSKFMAGDHTGFDLIIVDGNFRHACTVQALPLLRRGGIFYLDNSDRGITTKDLDTRMAEEAILEFARSQGAEVRYFTDFTPTQFFAQQGLMINLPS